MEFIVKAFTKRTLIGLEVRSSDFHRQMQTQHNAGKEQEKGRAGRLKAGLGGGDCRGPVGLAMTWAVSRPLDGRGSVLLETARSLTVAARIRNLIGRAG